ncbi:hypothetical protein RYR28_002746 [Edwardsiella piscicida]|uniref:hypothetical protein n=1 Tax=Edwardsiella piscicida TaxID=1263550 RepID=UPI0009013085|nr:hypothetical protein [Edwardsiella piscicida]EKS7766079.1 hypothetical protein [Edwardsiella piscicida]EKS7813050.1 hypothetical protein [Edwardsiella piscicida]ELM3723949.1 hypothetical protein [Edwardsiella piscicida]UBU79864.1 hypothetical protein A9797_18200 [Edwardsiella piscicida]UCQ19963.1 hypothetical protein DCE66_10820 [Edwardsiella piscicida]
MKKIMIFCMVTACSFLSACGQNRIIKPESVVIKPASVPIPINVVNKNDNGDEKIVRCRRELDALKSVDLAQYKKRKQQFELLMKNASLYNSIRADINSRTQNTVDALYQFKADKLCADVSSDVFNFLTK